MSFTAKEAAKLVGNSQGIYTTIVEKVKTNEVPLRVEKRWSGATAIGFNVVFELKEGNKKSELEVPLKGGTSPEKDAYDVTTFAVSRVPAGWEDRMTLGQKKSFAH